MNKLDKHQRKKHETIGATLSDTEAALQGALDELKSSVLAFVSEKWAELQLEDKHTDFAAARTAAREFRDEVVQEMDDYAADRAEKWADSESGQAFESWKGDWEMLDCEDPDPIDLDALKLAVEGAIEEALGELDEKAEEWNGLSTEKNG